MTRRTAHVSRALILGSAALVVGCGGAWFAAPAVEPSPPPADPGTGGLRAGFGRADITPPPSGGLVGYGPEGKRVRGWRQRLHARALVLEDGSGERIGIVTLELGMVSPLLHREVAARIRSVTGLGPDRLVLAATHTHAGPSHHLGHPAYDALGSSVSGFDSRMVDFLADRIARAVLRADSSLGDARVAWGTRAVWDLTRNRSPDAFDRNDPVWRGRFRKPLGSLASGKVDSTLAVLRVDIRDAGGDFQPAGALTVFAIHGTGIPSANQLYDSDIHGIAARVLEEHIDSVNGRGSPYRPDAVHLIANGAEGDVAPDLPANTRCQVPTLERVRRPAGPRTPPGPELWIPPDPTDQAACLRRARSGVIDLGTRLGSTVVAVFDSLGEHGHLTRDFEISRVFRVVNLADSPQLPDLCHPQPGTATLAGAEDGYTRYRNWRWLGLDNVGFAEDSAVSARDRPDGCHGLKRPFLGRIQRTAASELLPEVAQITVAALGEILVVTLPFEATTVVGGMIREAALEGAASHAFEQALLIGLANGYNQYVATPEEYALQHYEGASTLYGPGTAAYLATAVRSLAAQLPPPGGESPRTRVPRLAFFRLGDAAILPSDDAGPPPEAIEPRSLDAAWAGDTLVVRWTDLAPGRFVPADGPVIELRWLDAAGDTVVARDGDPEVEVWEMGPAGRRGWRWHARWTPRRPPTGPVEVVLPAGRGTGRVSVVVR